MPIFAEEAFSRFPEIKENLITLEAFYDWNCGLVPSSIRLSEQKPKRMLGHMGSIYTYRLVVRSRDAVDAFASAVNRTNTLMAALAARAHAETTGGAALFLKKLRSFYAGRITYEQVDETLHRLMMGSKTLPGKDDVPGVTVPDPINVMNLIDAIEDLHKPMLTMAQEQGVVPEGWRPFRDAYDCLSEMCHPNFAGTAMGSRTIREDGWPAVTFTQRPSMTSQQARDAVGSFMRFPDQFQRFVPEILQLLTENEDGPVVVPVR